MEIKRTISVDIFRQIVKYAPDYSVRIEHSTGLSEDHIYVELIGEESDLRELNERAKREH